MNAAGQCRSKEMVMGRGADGGCGTDERPCPVSRGTLPPEMNEASTSSQQAEAVDVDFFSQARKALCELSPFDVSEDGTALVTTVPTLPSGLASLLKHSDSRKRQKKLPVGAEKKKKSAKPGEKSRGRNIWTETEDYFRDLTLPDIDALFEISLGSRIATRKCLSIPALEGDDTRSNAKCSEAVHHDGVVFKEEDCGRTERYTEVGSIGTEPSLVDEQACSVSGSCSSFEWILGCKDRIYLNSERPSKKRKFLGSDAGLEKIITAQPCAGSSSICDFCCKETVPSDSSQLVICSSCKVVVHKKCYGVPEDVDGSWLCSWCSQKHDKVESGNLCVLCPKNGGAVKRVRSEVENNGSLEFAHLFCSQWMPEIYVEDLIRMEPIMNVNGIKENRRNLVCNICKTKCGVCVRCSHGTCRIPFHPICAREAGHRMEIWGKFGYDVVELRAFCSKHSDVLASGDMSKSGSDSVADSSKANSVPGCASTREPQDMDVDCRNGDDAVIKLEVSNSSEVPDDFQVPELFLNDREISPEHSSEYNDGQKLSQAVDVKSEDVKLPDPLNFLLVLKKLIERGNVNVKEVALAIGVSPDSLALTLEGDSVVPELRSKLVKWLKDYAYTAKDLMVKIRRPTSMKGDVGGTDDSDSVALSECDASDPVAVKSVPPRRRTQSNVRILKDNTLIDSSRNTSILDNIDQVAREEAEDGMIEFTILDVSEKHKNEDGFEDSIAGSSRTFDGSNPNNTFAESSYMKVSVDHPTICKNESDRSQISSTYNTNSEAPDLLRPAATPNYYVHPYIQRRLLQMQDTGCSGDRACEIDGVASADASTSCSLENEQFQYKCTPTNNGEEEAEQLAKTKTSRVLELSPNDELEGEIIYFQHRLLNNAIARKPLSDDLIHRIEKTLPQEIDTARSQRWDAVLINRYLYERKEAKKQGRKERRHKEAQAVLAAATAAAAASSRTSSLRKDPPEDSATQQKLLKFNTTNGRGRSSSQPLPWVNEAQRMGIQRDSAEDTDECARLCDICSRSDTIMKPILVCSSCKVAVHLDCYRSLRDSTGPWYCELCAEVRSSGVLDVGFRERVTPSAECILCGGTTGAFRKSIDRQWVHAFCAEWLLEASFRRGQVNPVSGMDGLPKGVDECNICSHKCGACIKCNFGHCQSTFHPSCARSSGLFMNVKTIAGKLQHKAYCAKHSLDQKAKAEAQRYGIEELKSIKQIRVELEKLRLLCERIIKREKVKREMVVCSHEILGLRRNLVARSVLTQGGGLSIFPGGDGSSDSATTTSLNCKSGNEITAGGGAQRSDDVVDSVTTVSGKRRPKVYLSMVGGGGSEQSKSGNVNNEVITQQRSSCGGGADDMAVDSVSTVSGKRRPQKISFTMAMGGGGSEQQKVEAEESSSAASQPPPPDDDLIRKSSSTTGKAPQVSGKQIPQRIIKKQLSETAATLEKELVMTSDQADLKNKLLPKGFAYVPSDRIITPKDGMIHNRGSDEPVEDGG